MANPLDPASPILGVLLDIEYKVGTQVIRPARYMKMKVNITRNINAGNDNVEVVLTYSCNHRQEIRQQMPLSYARDPDDPIGGRQLLQHETKTFKARLHPSRNHGRHDSDGNADGWCNDVHIQSLKSMYV